ncbi:MAG TPA: formylmethanofuran dehydrogenase subunit B, partial [Isosphaeraceae bacterium]|nr:formylmethanofuran dehydrogenase subunit B [Isosphaeraceae bacterium]
DQVLPIPEAGYLPAFSVLRALLRRSRLDASQVQSACGVSLASLEELAHRLRSARYGALFLGDSLASSASMEAALLLVRDLNEFTRFVTLGLGGPGNLTGAEAVLGWQAGQGLSTDFSRGIPRFLPEGATAEARLLAHSADAAVIVCDDPSAWLSDDARARLNQIPTVWIDPDATDPTRRASVALACAEPGFDAAGTVMRTDGVSLPLRPALPASRPSASELLRALLDRLDPSGGQES